MSDEILQALRLGHAAACEVHNTLLASSPDPARRNKLVKSRANVHALAAAIEQQKAKQLKAEERKELITVLGTLERAGMLFTVRKLRPIFDKVTS